MSKSNTKSNRNDLPNGCSCSDLTVTPGNWLTKEADTKTDWVICYTFFDPDHVKGVRKQVRGYINELKDVSDRRALTKAIMKQEEERLSEGYNPIKRKTIAPVASDLGFNTPFINALWMGVANVRVSDRQQTNLKSVVRGVEKSAIQLNYHTLPVSTVTRKYFHKIFKQCYKNNTRFTGATQNTYKKSLSRIYRELYQMEMVDFNPLPLIDKARVVKKARVMPTKEDRNKLNSLKATQYYLWRAINVFFTSGARESELMRLQAVDVNLKTQECTYTIEKGVEVREGVVRPIPNVTLHLWKEIMKECKPADYLFSRGLRPGPKAIRPEQFSRRWRRHVKGDKKKGKLGINIDLYSLKHLFVTETMDALDKKYNYDAAKDVKEATAHTSTGMIVKLYDVNNKDRKNEKIKKEAKSL